MKNDTLGDRLKTYAKARHGSIEELARVVGVNGVQMQKYASGGSKPGAETLTKLRAIGLSVDWLLSGKGPMECPDETDTITKVVNDALTNPKPAKRLPLTERDKELVEAFLLYIKENG